MKNWRIMVVLLLSLVLAGSIACSPFGGGNKEEVSQQLAEVRRGDIVLSVAADGSLSLLRNRGLTFGTSGKIAKINVEDGDRVTEAQVLASLDTTTLERTVKSAERAVTTAELAVKTGGLAVQTAELDVKAGELAVKSAEIDLELATNDYQKLTAPYPYITYRFALPESVDAIRIAQAQIKEAQDEFRKGLEGEQYSMAEVKEKLLKAQENLAEAETKLAWGFGGGIRPENIDYWTLRAAQVKVDKAQLALDTAKNSLDKVKHNLDVARNNLDVAKNNLGVAKNDLDRANDELEKAVILAPFDGIIARVNVKEWDMLSSMNYATKVIVELIDPASMELSAEVDEIDIPDVKLGQRAIISVDALPDAQFEGRVTSIRPLPIEEAGLVLYTVKIGLDVPEGSGLKAGMSATADIIIDERSSVLLVPNRAVMQDSQGNPMVEVLVDEQIQERPVVIGISDGYQTEIVDGLYGGEVVVVRARTRQPGGPGFLFGE